jgi:hypothetical protein
MKRWLVLLLLINTVSWGALSYSASKITERSSSLRAYGGSCAQAMSDLFGPNGYYQNSQTPDGSEDSICFYYNNLEVRYKGSVIPDEYRYFQENKSLYSNEDRHSTRKISVSNISCQDNVRLYFTHTDETSCQVSCIIKSCPIGEVQNNATCQCEPITCPQGQVLDANGTCVPDCTLPDTEFPQTSLIEVMKWKVDNGDSARCSSFNGRVQSRRVACEDEYRCVTDTCSAAAMHREPTGSYVIPKDGVFHEDIAIDGVDFDLHYQSVYLDESTSFAKGWNFSNHARIQDNILYLGNGSSFDVNGSIVYDINMTKVTVNSSEYLFDTNRPVQPSLKHHTIPFITMPMEP